MIIAISGPAAAGKGTLARLLAKKLNLPHYDFGLIYRAIGFLEPKHGIDKISKYIQKRELRVKDGKIIFRWVDITKLLSSEEVGLKAAKLASKIPDYLVATSQSMVHHRDFVCDGRTCGIEIYPDADYKFHITANDQERIARRAEGNKQEKETFLTREHLDRSRLKNLSSCTTLDTTNKSVDESLQELLSYLSGRTS